MYGLRDKVVSARVDSDLLEEFKQTVAEVEKNVWKHTNISDLLENALKNYIEKHKVKK